MITLLNTILAAGYQLADEHVSRLVEFFRSRADGTSPALQSIGHQDRDMLSTLLYLAESQAIVNIERYEQQGTARENPKQQVLSAANRHGQVFNVSSSSSKFTFGFNFIDVNVVDKTGGKATIGAPRIFNVTGHNGEFYNGISTIQNISTDTTMEFNFVVHPALGQYIYSAEVRVLHALMERCSAEEKFCRGEIKKIREALVVPKEEWPDYESATKEVTYKEFKLEMDLTLGQTTFEALDPSKYNKFTLKTFEERASKLNNYKKKLFFIKRMVELAFSQNKQKAPRGTEWRDVKAPRERIARTTITLEGVTLRYIERDVTKKV